MSEFPQGWVEAALDEIAIVNPGRIDGLSADTSISFVPMTAVSDVEGEIVKQTVRPFGEVSIGYTQFQEGDVIFAKITPCMENGKIAVARSLESGVACGSTEFHVVRPLGENSPDFIWRFLRQKSFRDDAEAAMTGAVGQRRVPAAYLKNSRVPLPPVSEQRRIAAKIDSLTDKSKRARDHLDHIPRLVEKYKQAVLAAAFRGDLTAYDRPLNGWGNWTFERADDVCAKVQSGGTPKNGFATDGIPFLKVYNIVGQNISFEYRPQFVRISVHLKELRKSVTFPGDVVMNIVGPPLGKIAVVPASHTQWNINQALTLFRPSNRISSHWIYYYLCSGIPVSNIMNETKGSAGQVNISLSQCRDFVFPVPSIEEQAEIVRRVEVALSWIDRLASEATSARRLIDRLDQAVLAKAFRGELVPQDPSDEPASVLLERIRAERGTAPKTKRGRKAKAAA